MSEVVRDEETENPQEFEKAVEELKGSAEALHSHFKKEYIEDHKAKYGKEPDPRLVLASRYTFDKCADMNWDQGEDQIKLSMQPDEIIPTQATFNPVRLGYNNVSHHYVNIVRKGESFYGVDFAAAQFGKLETDDISQERNLYKDPKLLVFEAKSIEDALETYEKIYDGGHFETTTIEESHRRKE